MKRVSKLNGKSWLSYEVKDTKKKAWHVPEDVFKLCFGKESLKEGDIVMGHFKLNRNGFKVMTEIHKVQPEKTVDIVNCLVRKLRMLEETSMTLA